MEAGKGFFDASSYMLFEASGDSESLCLDGGALDLEYDAAAAAGENDAQSCSYVSSADSEIDGDAAGEKDGCSCPPAAICEYCFGRGPDGEEGGGREEEDGVVDQCDAGSNSKASEDSSAKKMNEREADRQFWEACLAS